MLKICKENKQSILEKVKNGHLDTASLCSKNLICGVITIFELIELYANSNKEVKEKLKPILERL